MNVSKVIEIFKIGNIFNVYEGLRIQELHVQYY